MTEPLTTAPRWADLLGVRARTLPPATQLLLLLAAHVLLWTWVGVASRSNFDSPGDMVEAYVWSQGWQWGYYKHPPLSAWVTGLWFSVVPESHAGYSLLAAVNSAVGLAGLALLAREFLPRHWVLLCVAAAALTPGVTTLAMRFNANAILISSWPWAMALFVRMMQRGRTADAMLCGLVCALAMLGKYYSGVMLVTLVACALLLPSWRQRLLTAAPWAALLVFVICMAPHTAWLLAQEHGPLQYAQAAAVKESHGQSLMRAFSFALSMWVFPLLAFFTFWFTLSGPRRALACWQALTSALRPRLEPLWLLGVAPIVATMIATVATGARTASVWGFPITAGVVLLAASRARASGAELQLPRLWRALAVIWLSVALLAPLWWLARAQLQTPAVTEPRAELAQGIDELWQLEHDGPLAWISGTRALAASVSFYSGGVARYWSLWNLSVETPWVDADDVLHQGGAIVCARDDEACQNLAETWTAVRRPLEVAKVARGHAFAPQVYWVYLLAPRVVAGTLH